MDVLMAAVWPLGFLAALVLVLLKFGSSFKGLLEARRVAIESENKLLVAEALERNNEAEIVRGSIEEEAAKRRAELRREAAEADAAAEVAKSTHEARIKEEREVIAARARGRALAAEEAAARGSEPNTEAMKVLLEEYRYWLTDTHHRFDEDTTLEAWLGRADLSRLLNG